MAFYESGRDIIQTLKFRGRPRDSDMDAVAALHAPNFTGTARMLMRAANERTARSCIASAPTAPRSIAGALAEWSAPPGLLTVEEAAIRSSGEWGVDAAATVRFELIGTPGRPAPWQRPRDLPNVVRPHAVSLRSSRPRSSQASRHDRPQFGVRGGGHRLCQRALPEVPDDPRFKMIRYGPGGITAADYDNDGFYDLFVPDGVASRLLRNTGDGAFADVTAKAGLAGLDGVSVGVFADYDNDGHKDFFVSRTFKPNQLFHNNGNGTFTDVTAASGIGADCCTTSRRGATTTTTALDLYVGRYLDPA
jgi:hypothetical protein